MASLEKHLTQFEREPAHVRFKDLVRICEHFFGPARRRGSSQAIFKTPWQGDPRVNIQDAKGQAKP